VSNEENYRKCSGGKGRNKDAKNKNITEGKHKCVICAIEFVSKV
jgi:hypothetical protein